MKISVVSNQLWEQHLHHKNWQLLQTRFFLFLPGEQFYRVSLDNPYKPLSKVVILHRILIFLPVVFQSIVLILIQKSAWVYYSKLHFQRLVPIGTFMLTVKMSRLYVETFLLVMAQKNQLKMNMQNFLRENISFVDSQDALMKCRCRNAADCR